MFRDRVVSRKCFTWVIVSLYRMLHQRRASPELSLVIYAAVDSSFRQQATLSSASYVYVVLLSARAYYCIYTKHHPTLVMIIRTNQA